MSHFLGDASSLKDNARGTVEDSRCESATFDLLETVVNGSVAIEITEDSLKGEIPILASPQNTT
ncbi:MAG: hypothetical protein OEM32_04745 [Acidimicrobiia bacterium]|nr:hypothetical protein [Acidimicrobiia bacterium]